MHTDATYTCAYALSCILSALTVSWDTSHSYTYYLAGVTKLALVRLCTLRHTGWTLTIILHTQWTMNFDYSYYRLHVFHNFRHGRHCAEDTDADFNVVPCTCCTGSNRYYDALPTYFIGCVPYTQQALTQHGPAGTDPAGHADTGTATATQDTNPAVTHAGAALAYVTVSIDSRVQRSGTSLSQRHCHTDYHLASCTCTFGILQPLQRELLLRLQ